MATPIVAPTPDRVSWFTRLVDYELLDSIDEAQCQFWGTAFAESESHREIHALFDIALILRDAQRQIGKRRDQFVQEGRCTMLSSKKTDKNEIVEWPPKAPSNAVDLPDAEVVIPDLIEQRAAVEEDFRAWMYGTGHPEMNTLARAAAEAGMSIPDFIQSELSRADPQRVTHIPTKSLRRIYDAEETRLARKREAKLERRSKPRPVVIRGLPLKRFYRVRRRLLDSWTNTESFLNEVQCDLEQQYGTNVNLVTIHRYGGNRIHVFAVFQVELAEEVMIRDGHTTP